MLLKLALTNASLTEIYEEKEKHNLLGFSAMDIKSCLELS